MKASNHARFLISLGLLFCMLAPGATLAFADGKKYFRQGMKHEDAQEWDKAVEQFALAVSDTPKNPEYRLHLTRALFNASQMFMKKGATAAQEKDYETGYLAFRKAYAFDPTNELAKSEMERMVRLQKDVNDAVSPDKRSTAGSQVKLVPAGMIAGANGGPPMPMPQKLEKLRDLPFPSGVEIQFIIKELAKDLDLNVLFDAESFRQQNRKVNIDLKNVTAARALDYIFLQEGLFFQKVGPRTILVATQQQRTKFQQLVLRTFYLANAAPKDIAKVVQTAIPAQPGRSGTIVLTDDATNSVTIRDTSENIRLIGRLIASLDKDRAEVVMDVAIYEVNKSDLLQFGNQIGNQSQLTTLGGTSPGQILIGGKGLVSAAANAAAALVAPTAFATGIVLPGASFSAFQSKSDTKLLASTQIHAFNNEDSSARIGQRVPVRSATFQGLNQGGVNNGGGSGVVSDVINYEQVGLTLKFKPIVFPNQDVQVAMEIESKDVSGAQTLTPTFTERTIKGTARIQNNKTLLLASVAQGVESKGRQGLPLLGLIPIIGRLFTAPTRDNRQVDIVIAVTPRVIRAPNILPEDEIERETGSIGVPTSGQLEAMIIEEEQQEFLAAARRNATNAVVQLPDQKVDYVRSEAAPQQESKTTADAANAINASEMTGPNLKPIDSSVKTLQLNQTADTRPAKAPEDLSVEPAPVTETAATAPAYSVGLKLGESVPEMKAGERIKIPVLIDSTSKFYSAVIGLKYDDKKFAIREVTFGDMFAQGVTGTVAKPFIHQNGKLYVTLASLNGKELNALGTLAFIEVEALKSGKPEISFDRDVLNFLTADGKNFAVKVQ